MADQNRALDFQRVEQVPAPEHQLLHILVQMLLARGTETGQQRRRHGKALAEFLQFGREGRQSTGGVQEHQMITAALLIVFDGEIPATKRNCLKVTHRLQSRARA